MAQGPPPPPPPLIYKAPEKSILQEFTSDDKSFRASFPGVPKMEEKKLDGSSSMTYSVYRQGSTSAILISEFDTNIENLKDKMYESAKVNLLKPQNSKIETEKDITINGISGKEFTTTDYYTYQKLRVFVKGNRVYLIMNDVTNWHILTKHYKDEVEQFDKEADRFLNSLEILK